MAPVEVDLVATMPSHGEEAGSAAALGGAELSSGSNDPYFREESSSGDGDLIIDDVEMSYLEMKENAATNTG
jgi:hypothetical protein